MRSRRLLAAPVLTSSRVPPSTRDHLLHSNLKPQLNRFSIRHASTTTTTTQTRIVHPLIPPPGDHSGPLLSRSSNRALPSLKPTRVWLKTLPFFLAAITLSSLAIFNYQKSSSSTVNSILYALRTNPRAREILGDEIYFASKIPWISGELDLLHGRIDVSFWVKGTRAKGKTRFVSVRRKGRGGYFETVEWSLEPEGGKRVQLLEDAGDVFLKEGKRSNMY